MSVYILGGYQTDFARSWNREGKGLFDMFEEALRSGLDNIGLAPSTINAGYVGNFAGELFAGQGLLGGFFPLVCAEMDGIATGRYEAACASGGLAVMAAMADIEAGRVDVAAVIGLELMKNVPAREAAQHLGAAMWRGHEANDATFPFPHLFGRLGDEYEERYGLNSAHLARISEINFQNARRNLHAQTRNWKLDKANFIPDDEFNPVIDGRIRKSDCSQVTDGASVVFLGSEAAAKELIGVKSDLSEKLSVIKGWGHTTAGLPFEQKVKRSRGADYVLPNVRKAITDARIRAGIDAIEAIDGYEVHDCFSTTEYMIIDHLGLTKPGECWKVIEDGSIELHGASPINPSGGLIGVGHPVGATGVRMMLDAHKQVTGQAEGYQIPGAKTIQILNLGGSATTAISFIVGQR